MNKIIYILTIILTIFIFGCSTGNPKIQIAKTEALNGPPLVIPPSLTARNISHFYDLSGDVNYKDNQAGIEPP